MLKDVLRKKKADIRERWLEEIYATYPPDVSGFLKRKKDRFANPAGHALREAAEAALDGVIEGIDAEKVCRGLEKIVSIRAVQDFSPSQAVSFVFLLRKAVRAELGEAAGGPELAEIDERIDQTALFAFDIFVRCRERLYELRVNEIKRNVSTILKRFNPDCAEDAGAQRDATECDG